MRDWHHRSLAKIYLLHGQGRFLLELRTRRTYLCVSMFMSSHGEGQGEDCQMSQAIGKRNTEVTPFVCWLSNYTSFKLKIDGLEIGS